MKWGSPTQKAQMYPRCTPLWFCQEASCHSPLATSKTVLCHLIVQRDLFVPSYFSRVWVKKSVCILPVRVVRCQSSFHLNLISVGYRSFEVYAPSLWNALPKVLRCIDNKSTFKKHLKHIYLKSISNQWVPLYYVVSLFF